MTERGTGATAMGAMSTTDEPVVHPRRDQSRKPMLEVTDLVKHFPIKEYTGVLPTKLNLRAVDGVSFDVAPGETLGLVGESGDEGCGTYATIMSLRRFEPKFMT